MNLEELNIEADGLLFERADEDGFHIREETGKGKIYVYFTELAEFIQKLKKIKYDWDSNFNSGKQSPGSKNLDSCNANDIYKSLGNPNDFKEYNRYINSNHWNEIRKKRIKKDNKRCRNCGTVLNLQVHHKNYKSFGNEDIDDLVTLCNECHKKIEVTKRKKRKGVVTEYE